MPVQPSFPQLPQASAHPEAELAGGAVKGLLKYLQDRQDMKSKTLELFMGKMTGANQARMMASQGEGKDIPAQPGQNAQPATPQQYQQAQQQSLGGAQGPLTQAQTPDKAAVAATPEMYEFKNTGIRVPINEILGQNEATAEIKAGAAGESYTIPVKSPGGGTLGHLSKSGKFMDMFGNKFDQTPPDIAEKSGADTTVSGIKTMQQTAPEVLKLADRTLSRLNIVKQKLGAIQGRWSDMMVGKVGMKDPDLYRFQTDANYMATLIVKMHFGSRAASEQAQAFKKELAGKFNDPDNLVAAIQETKLYARDLMGESGGDCGKLGCTGIINLP